MHNQHTNVWGDRVTTYPSGSPHQPQQQNSYDYPYQHGSQSLRPPPVNSGYPDYRNSSSSHASKDSGYGTHSSSSVAGSTSYPYLKNLSPASENARASPMSFPREKKEHRPSTPSSTSAFVYPCLHPGCGHVSSRAHNLKRHMTVHFPPAPEDLLDCRYEWCGRTGAHGFKREDHRKEHYRKVHMKESEFPKRIRNKLGRRSSPAVSTTHCTTGLLNNEMPVKVLEKNGKSTVKEEEGAPLSSNLQFIQSLLEAVGQPTCPVQDKLAVIKSQILESLSASEAGLFCASLTMQWDILGFMEDQFRDNDFPNTALGPIVTISGSAQHAQAMTCSDYIRQNWPTHGSKILNDLQGALDSPTHTSQSELVTCMDHGSASSDGNASSHAELDIDVTQKKFFLKISSTSSDVIADVVQQLIWMGAALQTSRDNRVQYSDPVLEGILKPEAAEPAVFNVLFDMRSPAEDEQSCWFPLFTNPVIAHGFPTAHRNNDEVGLEIPLEMMAALGGARQAVEYEGGLVLKGYSALFVPIKRQKESVQWHLIRASGDDRISYREASVQCPNRVLLKDLNHKALKNTRAYLGWWKKAETHLGTAGADYESIDWSPAGEARRPPRLSGANIGFSSIVTGQVTFIPGTKDGRLHFSQKGPFQRIVQRAEKTPVALYDVEDRRAWLVPALDVMVHIVQTRHHSSPYNVDGRNVELTPVIPEKGRGAAREAVAANQLRQLYECDVTVEKGYYYKDVILDIWSQMDFMMEKDDSIEACPGLALHGTMQSKVHGWEYMSLVNEKNYRRKEATIEKSCGGWVDLINDIEALVLFATGFREVIRPVSGLRKLCSQWGSLPKSKDYLAAGVPIMELLYSEAGSRLSRKHLSTTHLQWHRGLTLFEQCSYTGPGQCECDRTQQIYHDSLFKTFGRVRPPGKLEENGCIILGQAHHSLRPTRIVAIRENAVHTLPNTSIQDPTMDAMLLSRADGIQSPSPPASFSPECEQGNGYAVRSTKRPPSPLSSSNELIQELIVARKRKRKTSHVHTLKSDPYKGHDDGEDQQSLSDHCARGPLIDQAMHRHNTRSTRTLESTHAVCASKVEYTHVQASKPLRHKARIGGYSHRYGCLCDTCSHVKFEPLDSIELICSTKGAGKNPASTAEQIATRPA